MTEKLQDIVKTITLNAPIEKFGRLSQQLTK